MNLLRIIDPQASVNRARSRITRRIYRTKVCSDQTLSRDANFHEKQTLGIIMQAPMLIWNLHVPHEKQILGLIIIIHPLHA